MARRRRQRKAAITSVTAPQTPQRRQGGGPVRSPRQCRRAVHHRCRQPQRIAHAARGAPPAQPDSARHRHGPARRARQSGRPLRLPGQPQGDFQARHGSNLPENPRGRKSSRRGRKRRFDPAIFEERFRTIERVFAPEAKFRRLQVRFERISDVHYAFTTLAYTMINLRYYC